MTLPLLYYRSLLGPATDGSASTVFFWEASVGFIRIGTRLALSVLSLGCWVRLQRTTLPLAGFREGVHANPPYALPYHERG